ncbi:MAG TPA: [NiFe]-hydrogenase assembly, chaperone, HybE [Gammaproteobacteria bacterium]|nr:[NiFe]-hydrogenase assembly, chaperone, HybE [Gammaproteobacteria bacterium]
MASLDHYIDELLSRGRAWFSREEALEALGLSSAAFIVAARRLAKKQRLVSPRRGFYLILRPEDRVAGAPDPARWIDPLMKYLGLDYRISLLRAAAFRGSSHQAAMVFQVIAPKQLRAFDIMLWPPGSKVLHRFPSGSYEFIAGEEEGTGARQMCSLLSPMSELDSQALAVAIAEKAMQETGHAEDGVPPGAGVGESPASARWR